MDAVVSGSAGVAFISDGAGVWSLRRGPTGPERSPRRDHEIPALLGDAQDLAFLEDVDEAAVLHELDLAHMGVQAIHLALMLCDPTTADSTVTLASGELDDLLSHAPVAERADRIFDAKPMPAPFDPRKAVERCKAGGREHAVAFFHALALRQPAIREVRCAWDALPSELFSSEEDRAFTDGLLAREGLFRSLVRAHQAGTSLDTWLTAARAERSVIRAHAERCVEAWAASLGALAPQARGASVSMAAAASDAGEVARFAALTTGPTSSEHDGIITTTRSIPEEPDGSVVSPSTVLRRRESPLQRPPPEPHIDRDARPPPSPPISHATTFHRRYTPTTASAVATAAAAGQETCLFIGPSRAGKTCTLASINASCYADAKDLDCEISVLSDPTIDGADLLSRHAVRWIAFDEQPPPTEQRRSYKIEVHTRIKGSVFRPSQEVWTTLRCSEERGGVLFQSEADRRFDHIDPQSEMDLLRQATDATSLVLVIDSTDPAAALIGARLSGILDRTCQSRASEDVPQPTGIRLLERLGLRRKQVGDRRTGLSAKRVLILLTKVDELALALSKQLRAQGSPASPLQIADVMDPVALAISLLGERTLRRIRGALRMEAELAVGLASAAGFHEESGETFLAWATARSSGARLRAWRPYGIREALLYITAGRCNGPVQRVDRKDALSLDGALPVDFYYPLAGAC